MTCDTVSTRLEEWRLGLLDHAQTRAFVVHVSQCAPCARARDEIDAFQRVLDLAHDPGRDQALVSRLRATRRRRRVTALVAAASLLLAASVAAVAWILPSSSALQQGREYQLAAGDEGRSGRAHVRVIESARVKVSAGGSRLRLSAGAVRFSVAPGHGEFVVGTPCGDVHVVGTEFEVRVMSTQKWAAGGLGVAVLVTAGVVSFDAHSQSTRVEAGELLVADADGVRQTFTASSVVDLLAETHALERENSHLRGLLEAPGASRPAHDETADPGVPRAADPPATDVDEDDPRVDWTEFGRTVADLLDASESTSTELEPSGPETMRRIAELLEVLEQLGERLGVAEVSDVFVHSDVLPLFLDGALRELLPQLGEDGRAMVVAEVERAADDERARLPDDLLPIERRVRDAAIAATASERLAGRLKEAQLRNLLRLLSSDRPGTGTSSWAMVADRLTLIEDVGQQYVEFLELEGADAAAARVEAQRFVAAHLRERVAVLAEHGRAAVDAGLYAHEWGVEDPDAQAELSDVVSARLRLLRVQAGAERALHDALSAAAQGRLRTEAVRVWSLEELLDDEF